MDPIERRRRTSYLAEYCLRCFAPDVFLKNKLDCTKHYKNECYVTTHYKHKFYCLNRKCLEHSWTCSAHSLENRLLLAAHHKEIERSQQTPTTPTAKTGHPTLFLFCSIPGRYRAANVFCDTGNPHCLFTTGTPENLCGIRTKRGP